MGIQKSFANSARLAERLQRARAESADRRGTTRALALPGRRPPDAPPHRALPGYAEHAILTATPLAAADPHVAPLDATGEMPIAGRTPGATAAVVTGDAAAANSEGRRSPRRKSALPAHVYWSGLGTLLTCKVLDMSVSGAHIELSRQKGWAGELGELPGEVTLVFRQDRIERDCEVLRRGDGSIGVKFRGPARAMARRR